MTPQPRRGVAIPFLHTNRRDALADSMTHADFTGRFRPSMSALAIWHRSRLCVILLRFSGQIKWGE